MPNLDCSPLDLQCQGAQIALDGFTKVAQWAGQFAGEMIGYAMTWWVQTPSVNPDSQAVRIAQSYTTPVILVVLMASILAQCIRIVIQRKLTPLLDLGVGIVRYVVVTTMGLMLLGAAVMAGDALSQWMLEATIQRFAEQMKNVMALHAIPNPFGLLIVALIALILGAIQWLLGFFRQAAILILAAMLPLAAAGSLSQSGKGWLNKMLPWLIALVAYKPMAAFIYVIGFTFLGDARDLSTAMTGIMVLILALIAMPALMRFFSWAGVSMGGGGGGFAGALGSFAGARMGSGGGATGAADQDTSVTSANRMANSGPGTGGGEGPQGAGPAPSLGMGNQVGPGGAGGGGLGGAGGMAAGAETAGAGAGAAGAGGTAAAGAGGAGAAAAAGPAGAAVGAGVAVGKAAYQGTQQAAGEMTGGAQSDDQRQ